MKWNVVIEMLLLKRGYWNTGAVDKTKTMCMTVLIAFHHKDEYICEQLWSILNTWKS